MRELVEHLQDTIEALKREIVRNPKSDEYRKALKGTGERLTIAKQILARLRLRPTSRVECLLHSRRRGLAHRRTAYDGQIATCLPSPFILPLWGYRP